MNKKCFVCGCEKSPDEFYVHKAMGDGRLGKCKKCCKEQAKVRHHALMKNPEWIMRERERCRIKMEKYRASGREKRNPLSGHQKRWRKRFQERQGAHNKAQRAVSKGLIPKSNSCSQCGVTNIKLEKHHDDYSKPLDIRWLCVKCHGITRRKPIPVVNDTPA